LLIRLVFFYCGFSRVLLLNCQNTITDCDIYRCLFSLIKNIAYEASF
jgi:hypothetical protein